MQNTSPRTHFNSPYNSTQLIITTFQLDLHFPIHRTQKSHHNSSFHLLHPQPTTVKMQVNASLAATLLLFFAGTLANPVHNPDTHVSPMKLRGSCVTGHAPDQGTCHVRDVDVHANRIKNIPCGGENRAVSQVRSEEMKSD
jgi:hypothetical protein